MRKLMIMPMLFGLAGVTSRMYAQEVSDTLQDQVIKEVTVSVNRMESEVSDAPRSVSVITEKEIKESGMTSVSDIISRETGLAVIGSNQTPGSQQSLFLRGANSNHTVVLIDGMRITDPTSPNNAINLAELNINNIERIEVVRGAHSTMYGTGAIGGVVNIITKGNAEKKGFSGSAGVNAGLFNGNSTELTENLFLNYGTGKGLYANVSMFNSNISGFDATIDTLDLPIDSMYRSMDQDAFNQLDIQGKFGYKKEKTDVFVLYKKLIQSAEIDNGAYNDDDNRRLSTGRDLIALQAKQGFNDKFSATIKANYSSISTQDVNDSSAINQEGTVFDGSYMESISQGEMFTAEAVGAYNTEKINVLSGVGIYGETMQTQLYSLDPWWGEYSDTSDMYRNQILHAFVNTELKGSLISDQLKNAGVQLGSRINSNTLFGVDPTFQINPYWKLKKGGVAYVNWSTGYNAPSLYHISNPFVGDSTLVPETSKTLELGFRKQSKTGLSFSTSVYQTVVQNTIEYVYLWDNNKPTDSLGFMDYYGSSYANLGKQTIQGIEIALDYNLNNKFKLFINTNLFSGIYEFDTSRSSKSEYAMQLYESGIFLNDTKSLKRMTRRANTANFGVSFMPNSKATFSILGKYLGSRYDVVSDFNLGPFGALDNSQLVNSYTIFDIQCIYRASKKLTGVLRVSNILNTDYREILGYNTRKRGVNLNVQYTF